MQAFPVVLFCHLKLETSHGCLIISINNASMLRVEASYRRIKHFSGSVTSVAVPQHVILEQNWADICPVLSCFMSAYPPTTLGIYHYISLHIMVNSLCRHDVSHFNFRFGCGIPPPTHQRGLQPTSLTASMIAQLTSFLHYQDGGLRTSDKPKIVFYTKIILKRMWIDSRRMESTIRGEIKNDKLLVAEQALIQYSFSRDC